MYCMYHCQCCSVLKPEPCFLFQRMYQSGEARWGTDESMFNRILCLQSYPQLRACFQEYHKVSKRTIEQAIKSEMSGNLELGMLAIGQFGDVLHCAVVHWLIVKPPEATGSHRTTIACQQCSLFFVKV